MSVISQAVAANLFLRCTTNLQDRVAVNNSVVTGAEMKLPISQQKHESGASVSDSPLPISVWGQTWAIKVKNHPYGPSMCASANRLWRTFEFVTAAACERNLFHVPLRLSEVHPNPDRF